MFWFFGPILSYFVILLYAGLGFESGSDKNLLNEYLIIVSWYYQILIFHTIFKKKK